MILAQQGALNVTVDPNGQLYVANTATTGSLYANNFNINGGILGLNITQGTSSSTPVVQANTASISSTARIGLQFGGFISSGTTAASVAKPVPQVITLISAGSLNITPATLNADNAALATSIPFLFESPSNVEAGSVAPQPLSTGVSGTNQTLLLTLIPRSPGATNADGTAGLGLSGDAYNLFPYTAKALANDPLLGAAIASNLTVTNGVGSAGAQHRGLAAKIAADFLAIHPRRFRRHAPGGDHADRPGDRPGGGAPAAAALLWQRGRRTDPLGRGIRRQHQQ